MVLSLKYTKPIWIFHATIRKHNTYLYFNIKYTSSGLTAAVYRQIGKKSKGFHFARKLIRDKGIFWELIGAPENGWTQWTLLCPVGASTFAEAMVDRTKGRRDGRSGLPNEKSNPLINQGAKFNGRPSFLKQKRG
jgi:hypothetical protein